MQPSPSLTSPRPVTPVAAAACAETARAGAQLPEGYALELSRHEDRMAILERKEHAAAERLVELEMVIAQMGGGKGAELLLLEEEIAVKKAALKYMEEERSAKLQAMEADSTAAREQMAAIRHETTRIEDIRLQGQDTSPEAAVRRLAARLSKTKTHEETLAAGLEALRIADVLDHAPEGMADRAGRAELRNIFTDVLAQARIYEFTMEPCAELTPGLRRMVTVAESKPGPAPEVVLSTRSTGWVYEESGRAPVLLRPAVVTTGSYSTVA